MAVVSPFIVHSAEKPKPIVFKAVTFLPKTSNTLCNLRWLIEGVEKQSDGQFIIDYRGGPEVIPPTDQGKAVQSGVVDMAVLAGSMYEPMGPMAGLLALSRLRAEQEQEPGGVSDLLQEQHRKIGLFYLGRNTCAPDSFFYTWIKTPVKEPKDLAGKKIGGMGMIHHAFMKALGSVPVTITVQELYTAIERGVADGAQFPWDFYYDNGMYQILKYGIDHPYFNDNTTIIINLNSWSRLPKHIQDLMRKVYMETLVAKRNYTRDLEAKQKIETMNKAGLKMVKFSGPDADYFVETAYEAEWEKQLKKYPEAGPKFKALMKKR
jgi:TRAP-type C4-dicarboxylate transport system substrate-binding protein